MEAKYHNYSTDQCNAMMMELAENEKHGMETKPKYLSYHYVQCHYAIDEK